MKQTNLAGLGSSVLLQEALSSALVHCGISGGGGSENYQRGLSCVGGELDGAQKITSHY